jgi:hypothetical protein
MKATATNETDKNEKKLKAGLIQANKRETNRTTRTTNPIFNLFEEMFIVEVII